MFGVPENAVFDPEALARAERQEQADARRIAKALFIVFLLFAPGFYWWVVASAWAPVSYFVALAIARPAEIGMIAIPVALYVAVYWATAKGLTTIIMTLTEHRLLRLAAVTLLIALATCYALFPRFTPVHGDYAPELNVIQLLLHAFGPQLPGTC